MAQETEAPPASFRDEILGARAAQQGETAVAVEAPTFRSEILATRSKGFWESFSEEPLEKVPVIGLGVTLAHAVDTAALVGNAMEGDPEAAQELSAKLLDARRRKTAGGWAGSILSELPGFMTEFWLSGGAASLAKKGASKAARKVASEGFLEAIDRAVAKIGRTRLGRAGLELAGTATRAAIQTALMPSTYAEVMRRQLPPGMDLVLDPANSRRAAIVFQGSQREFAEALPEGVLSSYIETLSEYAGELIPTHYLGALQGAMLRRWLKVNPSKTVEDFLRKVQYGARWDGIIGEWAEERLSAAGKAAVGLDPWSQVFPDAQQMLGELGAFAVAQGGMSAAAVLGGTPVSEEAKGQAFQAVQEPAGSTQEPEAPEVAPELPAQPVAEEAQPAPVEEAPPPAPPKGEVPRGTPEPVYDEPQAPPADPVPTPQQEAEVARQPAPTMTFAEEPAQVFLADGSTLPVRYALVEADELLTSHDPARGFAIRPGGDLNERPYHDATEGKELRQRVRAMAEAIKPELILSDSPTATDGPPIVTLGGVVLGGNARGMAQQIAYQKGGEQAGMLRAAVEERAQALGLDASGYRQPVLVRTVDPEHQGAAGELSRVLNQGLTAPRTRASDAVSRGRLVSPEAAAVVANRIGEGTLREALNDQGKARDILRALIETGAASQGDVTEWVDHRGIPTAAGKDIIENALLGSVVPDVRTISQTPPSVRNSLLRALPALVQLKSSWPEFAGHMVSVLDAAAFVRQSKLSLDDALRQATLEPQPWKEDDVAVRVAAALIYESPSKFAGRLAQLAREMRDVSAGQGDFFLTAEERTPEGLVERAFGGIGAERKRRPRAESAEDAIDDAQASVAMPLTPPSLMPTSGTGAFQQGQQEEIEPGIFGTIERTAGKAGLVNKLHVNRALRNVLKAAGGELVPLLVSPGMKSAKALGLFMIRERIIKLRQWGDIRTMAHEVGHAFAELVFGDAFLQTIAPDIQAQHPKAVGDLVRLSEALYPGKPELHYAEGFAEFMRLWLTNPGEAAQAAPNAMRWFEEAIVAQHPALAKALDNARHMIELYRTQGSVARARASQVAIPKAARWKAATREFFRARTLWRWFWSSADALDVMERVAGVDREKQTLAPSNIWRALQGVAGPIVNRMVTERMIDARAVPVGPSFMDALAKLSRKGTENLATYMHAMRTRAIAGDFSPATVEMSDAELRKTQRQTGMSIVDARAAIPRLLGESPEIEHVAELLWQWKMGVQNYTAQVSQHAAESVKRMRAANVKATGQEHGFYAPLNRVFEEEETQWYGFMEHGTTRRTPGLFKYLKGSGRPAKPILEGFVLNSIAEIAGAHRKAVWEAAKKMVQANPGLGSFMHRITLDQEPAAKVNIETLIKRVRAQLGEAGQVEATEKLDEVLDELTNEAEDLLGMHLTFFAPTKEDRKGFFTVSEWNPYTRRVEHWRMNRQMYETLASIEPYRLPFIADLLLRIPRDFVRLTATGLRASFGWGTNLMVDLPTALVNTRASGSGAFMFWNWWRSFGELFVRNLTAGSVESTWVRIFEDMGLGGSTRINEDTRWVERTKNRILAGRNVRTLHTPKQIAGFAAALASRGYHYTRELLGTVEGAGRIAEMRLVAAERFPDWRPGEPMSVEQRIGMAVAAKQVTGNFGEMGTVTRVVNQMAPFFGASIAGPREAARAFQRNPRKFLLRGMMLTTSAIAYWIARRDDDWWNDADPDERFRYLMFPMGDGPNDDVVRWRVPHEIGYAFISLPIMMLDSWYREDPESVNEALKAILDGGAQGAALTAKNMRPPVRVPLATTLIEEVTNYSFDNERQIVPTWEGEKPPEQQKNAYTTRAATLIAEWAAKRGVYLSPLRIDHVVKGVSGGTVTDILRAAGLGPAQKQGEEQKPYDIYALGAWFRPGGKAGYRSVPVQSFYENYEKLQRARDRGQLDKQGEKLYRELSYARSAISAIMSLREDASRAEQEALLREVTALAKKANSDLAAARPSHLTEFAREAKTADARRERRKLEAARAEKRQP